MTRPNTTTPRQRPRQRQRLRLRLDEVLLHEHMRAHEKEQQQLPQEEEEEEVDPRSSGGAKRPLTSLSAGVARRGDDVSAANTAADEEEGESLEEIRTGETCTPSAADAGETPAAPPRRRRPAPLLASVPAVIADDMKTCSRCRPFVLGVGLTVAGRACRVLWHRIAEVSLG